MASQWRCMMAGRQVPLAYAKLAEEILRREREAA